MLSQEDYLMLNFHFHSHSCPLPHVKYKGYKSRDHQYSPQSLSSPGIHPCTTGVFSSRIYILSWFCSLKSVFPVLRRLSSINGWINDLIMYWTKVFFALFLLCLDVPCPTFFSSYPLRLKTINQRLSLIWTLQWKIQFNGLLNFCFRVRAGIWIYCLLFIDHISQYFPLSNQSN